MYKRQQFPLNLSYRFVKLFDGENDGLVSVNSMKWGNRFIFLEPKSKRGKMCIRDRYYCRS